MTKVIIPYSPRVWADKLHNSNKRWNVIVAHRRAGKTVASINHLIRDALRISESKYAYIANTYKQAKNIAWDYLKYYSRVIPGIKTNESELRIDYPNGSRINLYGSENVDALRGIGLNGGVQDESAQQPSNLFSEVISKCLADRLGYWIWIGTPKGKGEFFRTYQTARDNDEYLDILLTIDDSLKTEKGKTIENLKVALADDRKLVEQGLMTEDEFQQEWYCSFESSVKGAYYAKELSLARIENRISIVPYDQVLKVHTVWDLGKGSNMAIGFYQKTGREIHMIDFWEGSNNDGIPQAIKTIQNKPYIYGKHFAPHDIKAVEMGTEKTRLETAEKLGIKLQVIPNIGLPNGINAGKLMFSRLWVDEVKCRLWLDAISQYHQEWDDKRGCFKDDPYHDWTSHSADVHRYASVVEEQMTNELEVKQQLLVNERRRNPTNYE